MACYHFTMKLDQRPDKTPVAAATHLDYINRVGKFKNIDFRHAIEAQQFSGNMLCPKETHNSETVKRLYQSVYGSIMDNGIGIESSDDASVETLQIALVLAMKQYGSTLNVQGDIAYKARVLVAASEMDLPVKFTEEAMITQYRKLQEDIENGRRIARERRAEAEKRTGIHIPNLEPVGKQRPPRRSDRLQILSQCCLDAEHKQRTGVLLQGDDAAIMEYDKKDKYCAMRRSLSRGIRVKAEKIADEILRRSTGGVSAASHVNYINRTENYAAKGGCIFTANHLPKWADGSARKFFQAADEYERANGTRYREIEFALPNELTLEQQREIIDTFIDHHLKDYYYAYAVHDKIGAMSNGERNTHVHIMFSERRLDDYEKLHEREAKHFFKQANRKQPERGGCMKDEKWNGRNRMEYLCKMREDFAKIQNDVLAKYGIDQTVDHRSLRAQYIDAIKKSNFQLARTLDRLPEQHIGPIAAANKKSQKVIDLLAYRAYKLEKSQLIYAANKLENEIEEASCKQEKDTVLQDMSRLEQAEKFKLSSVGDLKKHVLDKLHEIVALNNIVIWHSQAEMMAQEKYLTIEERIAYRSYNKCLTDKAELESLRRSMPKQSDSWSEETAKNHHAILMNMDADLKQLTATIEALAPKIHAIEQRLSKPKMKSLLQAETERIMQNDLPQRERLNAANEEMRKLMPELKEAVSSEIEQDALRIIHQNDEKTRFTAKEVAAYLKQAYILYAKDYKIQQRQADKLAKSVISVDRATFIARNLYVKGAFKKLRADKRSLEKEKRELSALRRDYETGVTLFRSMQKPKWYQDGTPYRSRERELASQREMLLAREKACQEAETACIATERELNAKCDTAAGQKKIAAITQGILRKNGPVAEQYHAASQKASKLYAKVKKIQELQVGIRHQIVLDGQKGISYTTICGRDKPCHQTSGRPQSGEQCVLDIALAMKSGRNMIGGSVVIRLDADDEELDFEAIDQTDREAEMEKSDRLMR